VQVKSRSLRFWVLELGDGCTLVASRRAFNSSRAISVREEASEYSVIEAVSEVVDAIVVVVELVVVECLLTLIYNAE
jgi:hypothetical protein